MTDDIDGVLTTRTGVHLVVRRARPEDEAVLAEFFTHVTPEDLRFRFLSGMKEVSHARLLEMTRADDRRTDNFLAFSTGETLVAVAMLASDDALRHGEVAISVRVDHKHMGISWELLAYISRFAEMRGLETIESIESRDNHEAIELERDMGFSVTSYPDDPKLVLVRRQLGDRSAAARVTGSAVASSNRNPI